MTKVVYKYEYGDKPVATLELPLGYIIVRVAYQNSVYGKGLMIWAQVNPDEEKKQKVEFEWFATGESILDKSMEHVVTLENDKGMIMHLFKTNKS